MCTGVDSGLAGIKFSGSPRALGANIQIAPRPVIITERARRSLVE